MPKFPPFDRMSRYRYAAFLFGIVTVTLWARFLGASLPRPALLYIFIALTTPGLALLLWNVTQESLTIYRKRKAIDRMLDERSP